MASTIISGAASVIEAGAKLIGTDNAKKIQEAEKFAASLNPEAAAAAKVAMQTIVNYGNDKASGTKQKMEEVDLEFKKVSQSPSAAVPNNPTGIKF